jgi:hypothetical protein
LVVPGITVNDDAGNTGKEETRRMSGGDAGEVGGLRREQTEGLWVLTDGFLGKLVGCISWRCRHTGF